LPDLQVGGTTVLAAVLAGAALALWMHREHRQARRGMRLAGRADALRAMSETLRDADEPLACAPRLRAVLAALGDWARAALPDEASATLLLLKDDLPLANDDSAASCLGTPDADALAGLWLCMRENQAFGPGTGRHEQQGAWYLPMRGRSGSLGAARLALPELPQDAHEAADLRAHAQALCDQMGLALQRAQAARATRLARDAVQATQLRNTLLAAISHDYRTPLATILGAASALQEQAEKLSIEQRRRLAASIVAEADQLSRLTDNALQLARLDAPGLALRTDWESAEEIVGAVLRRLRTRDPQRRVRARVEPDLPLLRCDAVLLVQLLDNLVDNALKHSGDEVPVEILVRLLQGQMVLAVRDRGTGVAPALRERVFEVYQRGDDSASRGAGVGLAVCRAIARAHGGELVYRPRGHGGASFECRLPVAQQPPTERASIPTDQPTP
jgi:two-component system sensor histidine kinase KdpD